MNFGFECLRISSSDIFPSVSYLIYMLWRIGASFTVAGFIAIPSLSKAFAVHFEAFRFWTLASKILNCGGFLLYHCQLGVLVDRALSLDCFFAQATSLTFGRWWRCHTLLTWHFKDGIFWSLLFDSFVFSCFFVKFWGVFIRLAVKKIRNKIRNLQSYAFLPFT